MKKILDLITDEVTKAFTECGYDAKYAKVTLSNRPDLCEYQCNGAMAAAKEYKKAPFMIADEVVEKLAGNPMFAMAESVKPGFLNLKIDEAYLADYVAKMQEDEGRFGCEKAEAPKTIMIDYGGPNVAKPLHVGHLRSAIIGESVKRIGKFMGHNVIGDVHLGDWGLQMGLIITELKQRKPELVYFDETLRPESIRRRRHLPSLSWRRFIRLPARNPKRMRRIRKLPCRQLLNCSTENAVIRHF